MIVRAAGSGLILYKVASYRVLQKSGLRTVQILYVQLYIVSSNAVLALTVMMTIVTHTVHCTTINKHTKSVMVMFC